MKKHRKLKRFPPNSQRAELPASSVITAARGLPLSPPPAPPAMEVLTLLLPMSLPLPVHTSNSYLTSARTHTHTHKQVRTVASGLGSVSRAHSGAESTECARASLPCFILPCSVPGFLHLSGGGGKSRLTALWGGFNETLPEIHLTQAPFPIKHSADGSY